MREQDPWTIRRYHSVDSTQSVAAGLIASGAAHRTVVLAERQTAGYGRKGDAWQDLPGACLLLTIIVRPTDHTTVPEYAMVASLACLDAIREIAGLTACVKWPNDVQLNGRKVAGILGDATWRGARLEALRLGIGMNISGSPAAFRARALPDASSIAAEAGRVIDRECLLDALLASFTRREGDLIAGHSAGIVAAWRTALSSLGERIVATHLDGRVIGGIATDIADNGDLIVIEATGAAVRLRAADVRSLRRAD